MEEVITSKTKRAARCIQFRNIPLVAIVILALIIPLVYSGASYAHTENFELMKASYANKEDKEDAWETVGEHQAGVISGDSPSERLMVTVMMFGILGIALVGVYISMRPRRGDSAEYSISDRIIGVNNGRCI